MFSVGSGFIPGKISLTSLSECELSSSTKSYSVRSAVGPVNPTIISQFISKNTQSAPLALLNLYRSGAQVANSAVTDILAAARKDWFGHPFHLLNGSPLPFTLSLVFFFAALHLISVLRLTAVSAFAHGL